MKVVAGSGVGVGWITGKNPKGFTRPFGASRRWRL